MSLPSRRWPASDCRLGGDALLQVAVGHDPVRRGGRSIVVAGPVELGGEAALGDGHADRVGEALAERPGRRLDAGRQAVLGMAGRARAPLAERLELLERDVVAGQVEERVEEHRGVAGGQDEPVAVRPVRMRRGVAQEARPEDVGHRRGAHRGAGMTGVRLLHAVDRQGPDRVDRQDWSRSVAMVIGWAPGQTGSDRCGTAASYCRRVRVALVSSVQASCRNGCNLSRAILGACHPSGPAPTPLAGGPADRRGR